MLLGALRVRACCLVAMERRHDTKIRPRAFRVSRFSGCSFRRSKRARPDNAFDLGNVGPHTSVIQHGAERSRASAERWWVREGSSGKSRHS